MIEVKNLSFSYSGRKILHDISFSAEKGEFISILGANGVGKSTLFKCILGILPGYTGSITIDGEDASSMSVRELAKRVAYIPQMSASAFNYSVEDIVLMGTSSGLRFAGSPGKAEMQRVNEALERTGIDHLRSRCFHQISGGEKQLVIIARALAQQADSLLLDEPSSALDFGNQMLILDMAQKLARDGYTVIQNTHNPEKAYMFSDKIIALKDGTILAQGTPAEVLTADNINSLYGVKVELTSLHDDKVRMFTPQSII